MPFVQNIIERCISAVKRDKLIAAIPATFLAVMFVSPALLDLFYGNARTSGKAAFVVQETVGNGDLIMIGRHNDVIGFIVSPEGGPDTKEQHISIAELKAAVADLAPTPWAALIEYFENDPRETGVYTIFPLQAEAIYAYGPPEILRDAGRKKWLVRLQLRDSKVNLYEISIVRELD